MESAINRSFSIEETVSFKLVVIGMIACMCAAGCSYLQQHPAVEKAVEEAAEAGAEAAVGVLEKDI